MTRVSASRSSSARPPSLRIAGTNPRPNDTTEARQPSARSTGSPGRTPAVGVPHDAKAEGHLADGLAARGREDGEVAAVDQCEKRQQRHRRQDAQLGERQAAQPERERDDDGVDGADDREVERRRARSDATAARLRRARRQRRDPRCAGSLCGSRGRAAATPASAGPRRQAARGGPALSFAGSGVVRRTASGRRGATSPSPPAPGRHRPVVEQRQIGRRLGPANHAIEVLQHAIEIRRVAASAWPRRARDAVAAGRMSSSRSGPPASPPRLDRRSGAGARSWRARTRSRNSGSGRSSRTRCSRRSDTSLHGHSCASAVAGSVEASSMSLDVGAADDRPRRGSDRRARCWPAGGAHRAHGPC